MALPSLVRRSYFGGVQALTLAEPITSTALSFGVTGVKTHWPTGTTGPFCAVLTLGLETEEKILCSAFNPTTGIVTVFTTGPTTGRAYDGTAPARGHVPQTGTPAAQFTLVWTAIEATEANRAVVNTIGRVTAAGDLLIASGPNAFQRVPIGAPGTIPQVNTAGNGLVYVDPAAEFGLGTAIPKAVGRLNASHGTSTLGLREDHGHPFHAILSISQNVAGPGAPTDATLVFQLVTATATTDNTGRWRVTLPTVFDNAFITALAILVLATGGGLNYSLSVDHASSTTNQLVLDVFDTAATTVAQTHSFLISTLCIGW